MCIDDFQQLHSPLCKNFPSSHGNSSATKNKLQKNYKKQVGSSERESVIPCRVGLLFTSRESRSVCFKIAEKIAEKAVSRSVFLTTQHCILSAELTKMHFFRLFFDDFAPWLTFRSLGSSLSFAANTVDDFSLFLDELFKSLVAELSFRIDVEDLVIFFGSFSSCDVLDEDLCRDFSSLTKIKKTNKQIVL